MGSNPTFGTTSLTGSPVDIRLPSPDEWRAVRALRLRALADAPDAFGSTLAREIDQPEGDWRAFWLGRPGTIALVATLSDVDGPLVGMAFGWPSRDDPATAGLFGMWVDPVARRQGLGAALVRGVVDWAREAGFRAIELGVTTSNPGAVAFYEGMGFVDTGERGPLRDGSALIVQGMTLALR